MNRRFVSHLGFTLAEVLITLGIIGVIAGLTIPSLMSNIQNQVFKTAAKKAYAEASQALLDFEGDNGDDLSFYESSAGTLTFKNAFMPYFNVMKDCNICDCVPQTDASAIYKTLDGEAATTYLMDDGQFVTNDGMFWGFDNFNQSLPIKINVDTNGYEKGPNIFGKDVVCFEIHNTDTATTDSYELIPSGPSGTYFTETFFCGQSGPYNGLGCTNKILNGK